MATQVKLRVLFSALTPSIKSAIVQDIMGLLTQYDSVALITPCPEVFAPAVAQFGGSVCLLEGSVTPDLEITYLKDSGDSAPAAHGPKAPIRRTVVLEQDRKPPLELQTGQQLPLRQIQDGVMFDIPTPTENNPEYWTRPDPMEYPGQGPLYQMFSTRQQAMRKTRITSAKRQELLGTLSKLSTKIAAAAVPVDAVVKDTDNDDEVLWPAKDMGLVDAIAKDLDGVGADFRITDHPVDDIDLSGHAEVLIRLTSSLVPGNIPFIAQAQPRGLLIDSSIEGGFVRLQVYKTKG